MLNKDSNPQPEALNPNPQAPKDVLVEPRLKMFPAGLGKGYDTPVLAAWMNDVLAGIDPASVDASWLNLPIQESLK